GAWSPPLTRFFVKLPEQQISQEPKNIVAWEYQFNNENRIKNEITPGSSFSLDELLDVSSLSDGLNSVTLRFRDDYGNWSSPLTRFFVKLPEQQISSEPKNIVACAYKITNQPAVLSEVTPTSVFLLEEQLNVAELPDGLNTFTVRFK